MSNLRLVLLYESPCPEADPYPVVQINDKHLLMEAGRRAIHEADARAIELAQRDDLLGQVGRADAMRLRDVLEVLIPGLMQESNIAIM